MRAVVVNEPDEDQIVANYQQREPGSVQRHRAQVSVLVGAELTRRAGRCRVPVVSACPWGNGLDRVDRALRALTG